MWFSFFLLTIIAGVGVVVFLILTIMKKGKSWIGLVSSLVVGAVATVLTIVTFAFSEDYGESVPATASVDNEAAEESEQASEEEPAEEIEEVEEDSEKSVTINETYEVNGLEITITNVEITEKDLKIGMELANGGENTKTFYPDQGDVVIGSKQFGANMFMTDGDVSGEIHAGVEKSGTIRFMADDDGFKPAEITEIKLMFGNVYDEGDYKAESFEEIIEL